MSDPRADREAEFREARAAVLDWRLALVSGASVILVEREETFALRFGEGRTDIALEAVAAGFLRLVDGNRTVGEIIDSLTGDMAVTDAVITGKAAMAAMHGFFLDGIVTAAL